MSSSQFPSREFLRLKAYTILVRLASNSRMRRRFQIKGVEMLGSARGEGGAV